MLEESKNVTNESYGNWSSYGERLGNTFVLCGLTVVVLQFLFFFVAVVLRLQKVKDVSGGLSFIAVTLLSLFVDLNQSNMLIELHWKTNRRQLVGSGLCCMWALRLAGYLLARNIRMGKTSSSHPDASRVTLCKHISYWVFQAFWVFVVSLPIMSLNSSRQHENQFDWTPTDIIGITVFSFGFTFEMISDQQKFNWKFYNIGKRGLWVTQLLWGWSRHPNYFFEILVWWGLLTLSIHTLEGIAWISIISPMFVMCMLLFVSGLPIVEAAADQKYAKYEEYREYKQNTSILIPIPQRVYNRIPDKIRHTVLLDFPIYNYLDKYDSSNSSSVEGVPVVQAHV